MDAERDWVDLTLDDDAYPLAASPFYCSDDDIDLQNALLASTLHQSLQQHPAAAAAASFAFSSAVPCHLASPSGFLDPFAAEAAPALAVGQSVMAAAAAAAPAPTEAAALPSPSSAAAAAAIATDGKIECLDKLIHHFESTRVARPAAAAAAAAAKGAPAHSGMFTKMTQQPVNPSPHTAELAIGATVWFSLGRLYLYRTYGGGPADICMFSAVVVAVSSPTCCRREVVLRPTGDHADVGLFTKNLYAVALCEGKRADVREEFALAWPALPAADTFPRFHQHDHDQSCMICRARHQKFLDHCRQQLHVHIVKHGSHVTNSTANDPKRRRRSPGAAAAAAGNVASSDDDNASEEDVPLEAEESKSKKRSNDAAFGSNKKKEEAASPHDVFNPTSIVASLEAVSTFYANQVVAVPLNDQVWRPASILRIDERGLHLAWFNLARRSAQVIVPWSACHMLRTTFEWHEIRVPAPHRSEPTDAALQFDSMLHLYPSTSADDCSKFDRLSAINAPLRVIDLEVCTRVPIKLDERQEDVSFVLPTLTVLLADGTAPHPRVASFFSRHSLALSEASTSFHSFFSDLHECDVSQQFKDDNVPRASDAWVIKWSEDLLKYANTDPRVPGPLAEKTRTLISRHQYCGCKGTACPLRRATPVYRYAVKFSIRPSLFHSSNRTMLQDCVELFLAQPNAAPRFSTVPPLRTLDGKELTELAASHTHASDLRDNKENAKGGAAGPSVSPVESVELSDYQRATLQWMIRQETLARANAAVTPLFQPHFEQLISLAPEWPAGVLAMFYNGAKRSSGSASECFSVDAVQLPRVTGGYVADEMGLGKSVEFIALLLHDARLITTERMQIDDEEAEEEQKSSHVASSSSSAAAALLPPILARNPHGFFESDMTLIVLTTSLVGHWMERLARFAPQLRVLDFNIVRQRPRTAEALLSASYDVVLVSKDVLRSDAARAWKRFAALERNEPWNVDLSQSVQYRSVLQQVAWRRIMLDESHTHKSSRSNTSMLLTSLNSQRRWCMSGTPVGQSATDLEMSLDFLGLSAVLRTRLGVTFKQEKVRGLPLHLLSQFAQHNMVRHERDRAYLDRPRLVQTDSRMHIVRVALSPVQQAAYDAAFAFALKQLQEWIAQYRKKSTLYAVSLLLEPLLHMCSAGSLDLSVISRAVEIFNRRRQAARNTGTSASTDAIIAVAKDETLMDRRLAEWLQEWAAAASSDSHEAPSCPICLGDGLVGSVSGDDVKGWQWVQTPCGHFFCRDCVDVVCRLADGAPDMFACSLCRQPCRLDEIHNVERPALAAAAAAGDADEEEAGAGNRNDTADIGVPENAQKLDGLCALITRLRQEDKTSKIVVTVAYGHTMKLSRAMLSRQGIPFAYMLSSFSAARRSRAVRMFESDANTPVLLMPMRSSAAGLSLGCANHLVIMDTVTNLSLNKQAATRVTRFDQTRAVNIHYFVTKSTIEERVFDLIQSLSQAQKPHEHSDDDDGASGASSPPPPAAAAGPNHVPSAGTIGTLCSMDQLTKLFGI